MSGSVTTVRGTAARLLGLLALVLGLLAMHGLASTHHASAAAPEHVVAPHFVADEIPAAASHAAQDAVLGPQAASPPSAACDDDCPEGLATVCAAVLAATAAATALVRAAADRRARLPLHLRTGPPARAPVPAQRSLPRPDPVAELCISRT